MSAPGPGRGSPVGQPRLYGNWRAQRGWGIGSLSTTQTVTLFVAVLAPVLAASVAPRAALVLAGVSVVVAGLLVVRVGGTTAARDHHPAGAVPPGPRGGLDRAVRRHAHRPSPRRTTCPGRWPRWWRCRAEDGRGGKQGLLWDRHTGWLTAILRVSPVGLDLADPAQADAWVAGWAALLADLGLPPAGPPHRGHRRHLPRRAAPPCATTSPPAPDPRRARARPGRARRTGRATPRPPAPTSTPGWRSPSTPPAPPPDPPTCSPRSPRSSAGCPGSRPRWPAAGSPCKAAPASDWLTGRLRLAYDPAARADVARLDHTAADRTRIPSCCCGARPGRSARRESWEHWRHDSGISVAWAMVEAPRQAVVARVLTPLLAPGPFPRRVTFLYEPFPAGRAAEHVEARDHRTPRCAGPGPPAPAATRPNATATTGPTRPAERPRGSRRRRRGPVLLYVSTTLAAGAERYLPAAAADVEQRAGHGETAAAPPQRRPRRRVRRRPRLRPRPRRTRPPDPPMNRNSIGTDVQAAPYRRPLVPAPIPARRYGHDRCPAPGVGRSPGAAGRPTSRRAPPTRHHHAGVRAVPVRRLLRGRPRRGCRSASTCSPPRRSGFDPAAWLHAGLVTNTGTWVQGQPGVGKSTIVKRLHDRAGRVRVPRRDPRRRQGRILRARHPPRRAGLAHRPRPALPQPPRRRPAAARPAPTPAAPRGIGWPRRSAPAGCRCSRRWW